MSGVLCNICQGVFQTSAHPCGPLLEKEIEKLSYEIMTRDTMPDFERGEYYAQDQMMLHVQNLTDYSNSALAAAIRNSIPFRSRLSVLQQVAENLEYAGYKLGSPFDAQSAEALHVELGILQHRAEIFALAQVTPEYLKVKRG